MNTPQPEFLCGMPQETIDWRIAYRHQVFIFERHREQETMRDLTFLIARWLRKRQHLPQEVGYVHRVQFPEQPVMELMAWTAHQAFQLNEPTDSHPAPKQLVFFTNQAGLLTWKQHHWKEARLPRNLGFMVHACCYDPNGERMPGGRLLTFDG